MSIVPWDDGVSINTTVPASAPVGDLPVEPEIARPGGFAVLGAAFRQDNTIGSLLSDHTLNSNMNLIDPDYNPEVENKGTIFASDQYRGRFDDIFNRKAGNAMRAQIQQEIDDKKTLDQAGVFGTIASLGASVIDLPSLVPVGDLAHIAKGGQAAFRSAASLGGSAAIGAGLSEAGLQATQQTRPIEQSAFAIGGSAILGSVLGAGVGAWLGKDEARSLASGIDEATRTVLPDAQSANEAAVTAAMSRPAGAETDIGAALKQDAQSAGAAAVIPDTVDDMSIAGNAAGAAAKQSAWMRLNPLVRLTDSLSPVVRKTAEGLMENPMYLKKNLEGRASEPAVETLVKEYAQGRVAQVIETQDQAFKAFRKSGGQMTSDQFLTEIGHAMRNGDQSPIPEVQQMAQEWRQKVFDPLKNQAIEAGMLRPDVDVTTADSYFSRMWNPYKIEAHEGAFKERVKGWINSTVDAENERLDTVRKQRTDRADAELADLQLPAEERTRLLASLPDELKQHLADNPSHVATDAALSEARASLAKAADGVEPRQIARYQEAERQKASNSALPGYRGPDAAKLAEASRLQTHLADTVKAAGKDYADFVSKRNALQSRIRRIRNNVVGREDQVEKLRGKIADTEAANTDRLRRLHRSLSLLDERMERESPEQFHADLSKARTDFAKVLERSNAAQDRLAQAKAKRAAEMKAALDSGDTLKANDLAKQEDLGDPFVNEAKRIDEMNQLADHIGELENTDPEQAVKELRMLVERRLDQAAQVVEDASKRIVKLSERLKASDPELVKGRIKSLEDRKADIERRYGERFLDPQDREDYVGNIVDEIFNRLTGRIEGDIPRDIVPATRGPLKDRTFNIPDKMVEDFLESNVEKVGRRYARVMAAEIEMTRKFGSADMADQIKSIQDDFAGLRAKAQAAGDSKLVAKLNKQEQANIDDVRAIRDILRGTYGARQNAGLGARAMSVANTFNFLRSMGGMAISSATDVARPLFIHGLSRYMGDGVIPLITNLRAVKASVREGRLAGAITEKLLNTRMATWSEITDPYSRSSPFERFLENTSKHFSTMTGMNHWNDFQKAFSSTMTQNRIVDGVLDYGKLKQTEKAYLAFLGIDQTMADRIATQFSDFGRTEGGIHIAGTEDWTDPIARRAYRAAINKDVDSTIVTKGVGDVPLFSRTPIGRAVLQFKSFTLAGHQRAFIRGLQGAELGVDGGAMGALSGMITTTAIGAFLYWLKAVESNHLDTFDNNPGRLLAEGLDRGGMLPLAFEINNTVEKAFGVGGYGALQSLFPQSSQGGKASRYMSRGIAATLAGPSGAFLDTLIRASTALNDGKIGEGDVNAWFNLLPFATMPGIRSVLEYGVKPKVREALVSK